MNAYEVTRSTIWLRDDGATASPYGAVPWLTPSEAARWVMKADGWTVRNPRTGQVGIGQPPCATEAEAVALAARLGRPSSIGIGD